ncbi:hypothetical protein SAMN05216175_110142 [Neptunomonas qingdaonensis]|uniref:Uncharacterized protein n=2 Tax=Neptunomonas qingdaonensis TaxID=1045558 RepID=A0A1I2TN82_9GAMM|nr:hypothetical protein SAMN05216175_110142 [Neptunomonas qingdaonensis]
MPRALPKEDTLIPNICYLKERHSLLKVPRVIIEFCINGTITGDKNFDHFSCLVLIPYANINDCTKSNIVNVWPTGFSFLGSVKIPKNSIIYKGAEGKKSDKNRVLNKLISDLGKEHMQIVSHHNGLQRTSWRSCHNNRDLLAKENIINTNKMMKEFASEQNITGCGSNYNYKVGRYIHRLCAFYMGFRMMGVDTFWMSYSLKNAKRACQRYQIALEESRASLTLSQISSSAWEIVEWYSKVSNYIMDIHILIIDSGNFYLDFLPAEKITGLNKELEKNFFFSPDSNDSFIDKETVIKRAQSYHYYRDKFKRTDRIKPNHKLVNFLSDFAHSNLDIEKTDIDTIDDFLGLWLKIIDKKYPTFDQEIRKLIKLI